MPEHIRPPPRASLLIRSDISKAVEEKPRSRPKFEIDALMEQANA